MNIFLVLCLFFTSTLASGGGGGGWGSHKTVRAPAFVLPIPEIGFTFDKLPFFIPIPKIVLKKNPALISKPVFLPLPSLGGFGHGGLSASFHMGGGGGGYDGGYGGGYDEGY